MHSLHSDLKVPGTCLHEGIGEKRALSWLMLGPTSRSNRGSRPLSAAAWTDRVLYSSDHAEALKYGSLQQSQALSLTARRARHRS